MITGYTRYPEDLRPRLLNLEDKYVRSARFESIGSGTSGSVTLPALSSVVLNSFGGTVDALVSTIDSGNPTFLSAYTAGGSVITATFNSSGGYSLSGVPSAYPVALIYRVRQTLKNFDSTSPNIIDIDFLQTSPTAISFLSLVDTPDSYSGQGGKIVAVKSDMSGLEFTRNLILGAPVTFLTSATTLNDLHYVVICDGTFTVTLPDAQSSAETVYFIKNQGTGVITIVDAASRAIDNESSFDLPLKNDAIMVVAANSKWWVI